VVLTYLILKKICNPILLSKNYFVLSNLLAKMSSYVTCIKSLKKCNLEGSDAFYKKLPGRFKIWKKTYFDYSGRYQLHMNFQPSPPYPNVATPAKVLLLPHQKLFVICNFQPLLFTFVAKNNALY
jgi:hypothetical protein